MIKALIVLLLLCPASWAAPADEAKGVGSILLVARAELPDPNFRDSVVLVTNRISAVPVGVVINRPTRISVAELFPDVEAIAGLSDKVYFGGPVSITAVSFVFRAETAPADASAVLDGVYFSTSRELLHQLLSRDKPMHGLRIFIGYASWGPGQLEHEVARGDWTLAPADANAIFNVKPERPWPDADRPGTGQRASSPTNLAASLH